MFIFDDITRYNPETGVPIKVRGIKEIRCDFTGKLIEEESSAHPLYRFDYENEDPCFGSCSEEFAFGKEHNVDMYQFLSGQYHFYYDIDTCEDSSASMLESYFKDNGPGCSFADICRGYRLETARKLVSEKTIECSQLNN